MGKCQMFAAFVPPTEAVTLAEHVKHVILFECIAEGPRKRGVEMMKKSAVS